VVALATEGGRTVCFALVDKVGIVECGPSRLCVARVDRVLGKALDIIGAALWGRELGNGVVVEEGMGGGGRQEAEVA
jgi:hypothetical protein